MPNTTKPIIAEMAGLLAEQKLVPFFGAGISRLHLGIAAAELAHELATEVGAPLDTLLSEVSDMYNDQRGEPAFIDFLKRKLVVTTLDDSKASTHRLLLSLGQNVLYLADVAFREWAGIDRSKLGTARQRDDCPSARHQTICPRF